VSGIFSGSNISGGDNMETTTPPEAVDAKLDASDSHGMAHPTFGVDEKKLVAKLDRHLIPLVMLLYTFSFLDRYAVAGRSPRHTPGRANDSKC
jgi:hypothetical protein